MRRRSEISTRDPPKIRSSSVRGFNVVRRNVETKDLIRAKRVKFMDPEPECQPNSRRNEPSVLSPPTGDPAPNAPKTSEYAFFKKLKKDAGCARSYTSQKEENQLKNLEPSHRNRGISEKFKDIGDNSNFSCPGEKVRPLTRSLFLSPLMNASTNSEASNIVDEDSHKDIRSPLFVDKAKFIDNSWLFSPLGGASKNSGTEHFDEIFDGKRERLRQWVANTSLAKVEESCSEGCDLVSVLINRLFPDTVENNSCRDAKPMQMRAETKFSWVDTDDKDYQWTQRRDIWEAEHGCYLDDVCNRSRELAPSNWDTIVYNSPSTSHASNYHFQCEDKKFSADYEGGTPNSIIIQDPYFCYDLENYGSTASRFINGLNDFQDMDESVNGRGPSSLLLCWDFENLKDGGNAEMDSTMAASWDNHQQSLDNSSVVGELDTSFFFSYPPKLTSLPHSYSASFSSGNEKLLLAELKHFPLSLPCTPVYHNLLEDCDTYHTCDSSTTLSPQSHHLVISNVFSETRRPFLEAFVPSSGLNCDLGWRCSSITGSFSEIHSPSYDGSQSPSNGSPCSYLLTHEQHEDSFYSLNDGQNVISYAEDTLDTPERSSTDFCLPIQKEMTTPLLLDSPSWLRTEDVYFDDGERIYM